MLPNPQNMELTKRICSERTGVALYVTFCLQTQLEINLKLHHWLMTTCRTLYALEDTRCARGPFEWSDDNRRESTRGMKHFSNSKKVFKMNFLKFSYNFTKIFLKSMKKKKNPHCFLKNTLRKVFPFTNFHRSQDPNRYLSKGGPH